MVVPYYNSVDFSSDSTVSSFHLLGNFVTYDLSLLFDNLIHLNLINDRNFHHKQNEILNIYVVYFWIFWKWLRNFFFKSFFLYYTRILQVYRAISKHTHSRASALRRFNETAAGAGKAYLHFRRMVERDGDTTFSLTPHQQSAVYSILLVALSLTNFRSVHESWREFNIFCPSQKSTQCRYRCFHFNK